MRVQGKCPRAKGMGEGGGGKIMFESNMSADIFFILTVNLSNLRHYYYGLRTQCNNDSCWSLVYPPF